MNILLICPNQASGIAALADSRTVATLPFLGEQFICYWMRHLASRQFTHATIITTDPVEELLDLVGDGSRWGMKVDIRSEVRELTVEEARKRHGAASGAGHWPAPPDDVVEMDHLPEMPGHKLFASYKSFFQALDLWLPRVAETKRIGLREIQPGVWVGRKTLISRTATLIAPCWIGENARIGKSAVVGPHSYLEDRVVLDENSETSNSWIAPDTFVGALTQVKDSLAWGDLLINWRTDSHTRVPDSFLMSSLADQKSREPKRAAARPVKDRLARPFAPVISLAQKMQS